jgi:hypothetical protein
MGRDRAGAGRGGGFISSSSGAHGGDGKREGTATARVSVVLVPKWRGRDDGAWMRRDECGAAMGWDKRSVEQRGERAVVVSLRRAARSFVDGAGAGVVKGRRAPRARSFQGPEGQMSYPRRHLPATFTW